MSGGFRKIIRKKPFLAIAVSSLCAVVFGCAMPEVTFYGVTYPSKPLDAQIDVYQTALPQREYVEIAMISCGDTDDNWNMKQILEQAREIGADAIIIRGRVGTYGVGVPVGTQMVYGVSEGYGITAVAIRYK
jgi:hypothetical protein